jgi:hypothetical protein
LLLALDGEKGTVTWRAYQRIDDALAGAAILELALLGRLAVHGKKLTVTDPASTGDELLDEALGRIAAARRPRSVTHWVGALRIPFRDRLGERLVGRGVVAQRRTRLLGVFTRTRYPLRDLAVVEQLRQRVRAAALGTSPVQTRMAYLLSLITAAQLVDRLFTRDERRLAKQRIREIMKANPLAGMICHAVSARAAAAGAGA